MKYLTQKELAYRVEMLTGRTCKTEYISAYENGTNPKLEIIVALAEILDIPEQYLFDDSERVVKSIISKELPNFKSLSNNTLKIPLVEGYVGAGSSGVSADVNVVEFIYLDKFSINKCYRQSNYLKALIVIGDSMIPYVDNADIVVFDEFTDFTDRNLSDGKYVISTSNGTMLKCLTFKSNGDIVISSLNANYASEIINCKDTQEYMNIVGVVVARVLKK